MYFNKKSSFGLLDALSNCLNRAQLDFGGSDNFVNPLGRAEK
jgi:hypothetical protein